MTVSLIANQLLVNSTVEDRGDINIKGYIDNLGLTLYRLQFVKMNMFNILLFNGVGAKYVVVLITIRMRDFFVDPPSPSVYDVTHRTTLILLAHVILVCRQCRHALQTTDSGVTPPLSLTYLNQKSRHVVCCFIFPSV